jgi:hypothetical protein
MGCSTNVVFSGQGHEWTAVGRFVAVRWDERASGRRSCFGHASILQDGASRGFDKEVFLRGEEDRRVFVPIFFFFREQEDHRRKSTKQRQQTEKAPQGLEPIEEALFRVFPSPGIHP